MSIMSTEKEIKQLSPSFVEALSSVDSKGTNTNR
jgi:hypothetical protein